MSSRELFLQLRGKCSSDDQFCEMLAHMLSEVAGTLQVTGSKHDIYDAIGSLLLAAGSKEED
jgi:hypothetical protein